MTMKSLTRAEAAGFLLVHDNFRILTHRRPDGDTVGSAAALCLGLRSLGKNAYVLSDGDAWDCKYNWLLEGLVCDEFADTDTVVSVDVAAAHMLSREAKVALSIDHHGSNEPYAENTLVDGTSASCAELVLDVLTMLGVEMDQKMAEAVYVGLSTDTGCFRYANTNAHTFFVASLCARAGAPVNALNQELFETNSLAKLRLQAWMVENLHLFGDGKFAVVAIPRAVEDMLGVTEEDLGNISSFPRTVAGVCMAATLRQSKDGRTKISVRAVPGYVAAALCEKFGGGGHKGAAGGSTSLPLQEAAKAVEDAMLAM